MEVLINDDLKKRVVKADEYVEAVKKPSYVRHMVRCMLWSLIPLLFFYQELSIGKPGGDLAPIKIPLLDIFIYGLTDKTLYWVFLGINLYHGIPFAFEVFKVYFFARPLSLFYGLIFKKEGMGDLSHDFIDMSDPQRKKSKGKAHIPREEFTKDSDLEEPREVGEYVLRRPVFGFLEHFCGKMFFPFLLWLWALFCIGYTLCPWA